ncbi:MAG: hypothetical protein U0Z75_04140 [Deinococcaceae bacterium]
MPSVYQTTIKLLADLIPPRALESSLQEAARQSGKTVDQLGVRDVEKILKGTIYRQLQLSVPAALAKTRIQQAINALQDLEKTSPDSAKTEEGLAKQDAQIRLFDETIRKFSLYFDWPETQKFRSLLTVIREEHGSGRSIPNLVRDASVLKDALERKLSELLVNQSQDLVELKADYDRVKSIGGPKVRRLDTLIGQISLAQEQQSLAPAEVDRARKLATELKKLVESSVISAPIVASLESGPPQPPESTPSTEFVFDLEEGLDLAIDFSALAGELTPEQDAKLLEIDLEEEARSLDNLEREFLATLQLNSALQATLDRFKQQHEQKELLKEQLVSFRDQLKASLEQLQEAQKSELGAFMSRLEALALQGTDTKDAQLVVQVALGTLSGGALVTAEIKGLGDTLALLERQFAVAQKARGETNARTERLLARQRDALEEYALQGVLEETEELKRLHGELVTATQQGQAVEETLRAFLDEQNRVMGEQAEKGTQAQLRNLKHRIDTLPELPDLGDRISTIRDELAEALKGAEMGQEPLGLHELMIKTALVLSDASQAIYRQLEHLEGLARGAENRLLADRIASHKGLSVYPDLGLLATEVQSAIEQHQLDQQRELRELLEAAENYAGLDGYAELLSRIDEARSVVSEGHFADLASLWENLETLSSAADDERILLDSRAERISEEYHRMRGLEGETVQMLGRLSKQVIDRKNLKQMSPEALKAYVDVIEKAEALLVEAQAEYEAAQAVLENLSAGNALEGLLDIFNAFTSAEGALGSGGPAAKQDEVLVIIEKVEGPLRDQMQALMSDPGVTTVALIQEGDLKFGRLSDKGSTLVHNLAQYLGEMSKEMGRRLPKLLTLEHATGAAIVLLYPEKHVQLLIHAGSITQSARLLGLAQQHLYDDFRPLL